MKILGFIICLVLLVALSGGGYTGYQALQTHIENSQITSVTPSSEGFILNGQITVENPSWLTLPLQSGEYTVTLESGEELGKGVIEGRPIPPGTSELTFQQEMKWVPSADLLMRLMLKEHVYANVKGTITLDLFGLKQITLPFEQRIDLAQYVQAMKKNIIQNAAKAVLG